jgi:hypothetical protein
MTTPEQPPLFPLEPRLTDRQRLVWEAIRNAGPDGLQPADAGALLHERKGKHLAEEHCPWCKQEGLDVLGSKPLKFLAKRKRGAGYVPRTPK